MKMSKKYGTDHAAGMTAGPGNTQAAANRATTGASARTSTHPKGPTKSSAHKAGKKSAGSASMAQGGKNESAGINAGSARTNKGKNNLTSGFQGFKG